MSRYMAELFYGKPEPTWVINSRRRHVGDPHYYTSAHPDFGPYTRGPLVPDILMKVPLIDLQDVARIKDVLSVAGVYNVVCDIPEQTVTVSSNLSPQTIESLVRRVFLNAHILNYIDPYNTSAAAYRTYPAELPIGHPRAYDDSYSYWGHTNYNSAYDLAYRGRAYDNEFRPSYYTPGYGYR